MLSIFLYVGANYTSFMASYFSDIYFIINSILKFHISFIFYILKKLENIIQYAIQAMMCSKFPLVFMIQSQSKPEH